MQRYAAIEMENLTLSVHLFQPLVLAEFLSKRVGNTVRGDLMATTVKRLHLSIVGPFVTVIRAERRIN